MLSEAYSAIYPNNVSKLILTGYVPSTYNAYSLFSKNLNVILGKLLEKKLTETDSQSNLSNIEKSYQKVLLRSVINSHKTFPRRLIISHIDDLFKKNIIPLAFRNKFIKISDSWIREAYFADWNISFNINNYPALLPLDRAGRGILLGTISLAWNDWRESKVKRENISADIHVVQGEKDFLSTTEIMNPGIIESKEYKKNLTLHEIKNAGHSPFYEKNDEWIDLYNKIINI